MEMQLNAMMILLKLKGLMALSARKNALETVMSALVQFVQNVDPYS